MKSSLARNILFAGLVVAATTSCTDKSSLDGADTTSTPDNADLVVLNARIYTSNKQNPWAQALVIKNGEFTYVGDERGAKSYQSATTVDLNGQLVIPGMVDSHAHPGYVNVEKFGEVKGDTAAELLESVRAFADAHPNEQWLRLCCWPTRMFVQGEQGPKKEVLDTILPDRLVWFESETAHDYWLNSRALEQLGIDKNTPDPRPGLATYARNEMGEPTGWVKEGAGVQYFAKHFDVVDEAHVQLHRESVAETLQILSRHGITSIFDAGNKGYGDLTYSVVSQLEKDGKLPVRYFGTYQIFTPDRAKTAISEIKRYRRQFGGELLQFKSVKLFMDGITANRSAAYIKPYIGNTTVGATMLSVEELRDLLLELHAEQLDLHVHSIGDLAVRTVLDAVEAARAIAKDEFYPRVTVAHLALIDPVDLPRMQKLGVIANFTPWWFGATPDDVVEELLGAERYANMYRAKTVLESGARYTFSSDEWWGGEMLATYISPYLGMQVGHTRQNPKDWWETEDDGIKAPVGERLSLEELLEGYTQNGAYQLRMENQLGSIEEGKLADFVVLNKDLFTVDPYEISKLKPSAVVMEGKLLHGSFKVQNVAR
ncbi:MAG: amidohydrolase [Pseudomonadota bacterium]